MSSDTSIRRSLVLLMAVATGLAVASNYYAQPLLPAIGASLHLSSSTASLIVTIAQIGYAMGLLFVLPLGDLVARRPLIVVLAIATAAALVWLGSSTSVALLLPAAFVVGTVSVMAQVIVPLAASLAGEQERGRVIGMVMSGLLIGVLLARTVAAWIAAASSWRVVYFSAAGAMLLLSVALWRWLPSTGPSTKLPYPKLVASVWELLSQEPILRLRSLYGALSFGTFSVFWTSMAFLLSRSYHYGTSTIGLFGLVGAGGALAAIVAGRQSDANRSVPSTGITAALLCVSWILLWAGRHSLGMLIAGVVVLDIGAQGLHITNQGEIYRLHPEARSRLTAAYMVCYFTGGALGSVLSGSAYRRFGWNGVCIVGAAFAAAALLTWLITLVRRDERGRAPLSVASPAGVATSNVR